MDQPPSADSTNLTPDIACNGIEKVKLVERDSCHKGDQPGSGIAQEEEIQSEDVDAHRQRLSVIHEGSGSDGEGTNHAYVHLEDTCVSESDQDSEQCDSVCESVNGDCDSKEEPSESDQDSEQCDSICESVSGDCDSKVEPSEGSVKFSLGESELNQEDAEQGSTAGQWGDSAEGSIESESKMDSVDALPSMCIDKKNAGGSFGALPAGGRRFILTRVLEVDKKDLPKRTLSERIVSGAKTPQRPRTYSDRQFNGSFRLGVDSKTPQNKNEEEQPASATAAGEASPDSSQENETGLRIEQYLKTHSIKVEDEPHFSLRYPRMHWWAEEDLPPRPKDFTVFSCLVLTCCNPFLGAVAFAFACKYSLQFQI